MYIVILHYSYESHIEKATIPAVQTNIIVSLLGVVPSAGLPAAAFTGRRRRDGGTNGGVTTAARFAMAARRLDGGRTSGPLDALLP